MKPTPAIETHNLTKRFGARFAIRGLDLTLPSGTACCLLGPNGAGKTTTIRALCGLCRPTAGAIVLLGHNIVKHPQVIPQQVGVVLDHDSFYPHLDAVESLSAMLDPQFLDKIRPTLNLVGLGAARQRVGTFSLGMRRRLSLAAALIGDPRLLLLDEPTSGLDPTAVADFGDILERLRADGVTILISSHRVGDMARWCTHVVGLQDGEKVLDKPLSELVGARKYSIRVTSDDAVAVEALAQERIPTTRRGTGELEVSAADLGRAFACLASRRIDVARVDAIERSLEDVFRDTFSQRGLA